MGVIMRRPMGAGEKLTTFSVRVLPTVKERIEELAYQRRVSVSLLVSEILSKSVGVDLPEA